MSGFTIINNAGGYTQSGKVKRYHVDAGHATLLAPKDYVRITGQCFTDGVEEVDAGAAAQTLTGVIVAIETNYLDLLAKGLAAGVGGYVYVDTDINNTFAVATSGGTIAATDVGSNADMVATAATATGGLVNSNMTLNAASFGTATAQFRVLALTQDTDGSLATAAGSTVIVRLNESTETGVVGV